MPQYDVTLRDYWRILRKRKVIVIFATIMLGLTSFATALISKPTPRYRTTAKIQYERSQSAQEAYVSALTGGSDDLATQEAVITGYGVVERVAHRLGRVDTTTATDEERTQAILDLQPMIQTSVDGLTDIISITITHHDPFMAKDIALVTAQEYREYNFESRNFESRSSRETIEARRRQVADSLEVAQERLKNFQTKYELISVEAETGSILGRLDRAQLEVASYKKLIGNITKLLDEQKASGTVSEGTLSSFPPEEAGGSFLRLSDQLQFLNQDRNRLLISLTEVHPEIVELDHQKKNLIKHMVDALANQREVLTKRFEAQQDNVDSLQAKFRELPARGIEMNKLYRMVSIQGTLMEAIEEQYQLSLIAQAEEVHEVTILQKPLLPKSPINPSTPSTVAGVGALLGLIIGLVSAFIAETLDTSIGTIEDVEEYLEVPVVGIIPQYDIDTLREAHGAHSDADEASLEKRLRLATHFEPQSTLAESYRALRTNIQFANLEKGAKVISMTSASHQEGKSTTIANLAIALAQAGNRVLLVDGDLRRPTLNRIFGLDREPGVTDVILGNYTWREVVRTVTDIMVGDLGIEDIMMTAGMDNLNILTSGVIPPNPAEITDSKHMSEFIDEVREVYDVVLFDSPPVLQATDATVLGTKMDGILMVYKIGSVSRGALRRAKLQLDNVGVQTLGVIINGLRGDISEDFKDLRYYAYYSYGLEQDQEEHLNPVVRYFNRTKRQTLAAWENLKTRAQPYLEQIQERLRLPGSQSEEDEYEEGSDLSDRLLQIFFWIFLVVFLAAGLLWQLEILDLSARQPVEAPQPTQTVPENSPPVEEEKPAPQEKENLIGQNLHRPPPQPILGMETLPSPPKRRGPGVSTKPPVKWQPVTF
ncbi:MAG: AAA family ATPase [bacterium]|nr:AAA family ATPase [bacterium]